MKKLLLCQLLMVISLLGLAQKKNEQYVYHIKKASSTIKVDGVADELAWKNTQIASDFFQVLPMDTSRAMVKTEVKLCYDDKNIYVVFINYNKLAGAAMVESLKRDFNFGKNDNDLLFIDTFDDQTNGFSFGSNAMGAPWDGLMYNGSAINLSWENKWQSEAKYDDEKWVWEAAIPFKTIRYKKGITQWGINFSRLDLKTTEKSSWTPIPRQFPTASLAYTGILQWDETPPAPHSNISIIPYMLGGISKNQEKATPLDYNKAIGFDAKVALNSAINLDMTVNPDFSQVDVDVQQTNLDRFELFYPERRQFFLENGDLFNNFGYSTLRPFFSRRIGLNAPIKFGARISGKLNKKWRIGVMDMQTGKSYDQAQSAQNFSVVALQRQVFKRSNISAIFVNRETTGKEIAQLFNQYNRTLGLEYNLASADNKWIGKALFMKNFSPLVTNDNSVFAANILSTSKRLTYGFQIERVGENLRGNEVGYVPRVNYGKVNPSISYLFFPKSKLILSHGLTVMLTYFLDKNFGKQTENERVLMYNVSFKNRSEFTLWTATNYIKLLQQFDPTNYAGEYLAAGTEHNWWSWGTSFTSKPQSLFTYNFGTRYGGYFADGKRLRLNGEIGYRFQPYVALTMSASYNHLNFFEDARLPSKLKNNAYDLWVVGPKIDITFSNKLYFTNFLQYNNQTNNFNINSRFQWRYSPASDLFIVYTDNYFADSFKVRNRAIVLKFTYWWNV